MTTPRCVLAALLLIGCRETARAPDAGDAGEGARDTGAAGASASGGGPSSGTGGLAGAAGGTGAAGMVADSGASGADAGTGPQLPADVLDLAAWKLTLPTGDEGSPTEILQPELATFELEPYFHLDEARDAVVLRAHAGGVTTENSSYPRCELREMESGGADEAAWSTSTGAHTMTITQAITHLPEVKPHVVAGQVHDAEDDVVMIRLEGANLFVEGGGEDLGTLDASYTLGTPFTVKIEAQAGHIRVFYEDLVTPSVDIERDVEDCYFKAGAYTQSSPERGDDADAYGEVVIYDLTVTHEP